MAPTLAELLAVPALGLRVVAGARRPEGLRRPVTWVAASELADPTPYLQGGELLLLTGLGADLDAGAAGYVRRLVAAGVAGVGFGVGVVHAQVPLRLVEAADAAGLPLLEVDRPTPFVAVGKALAGLLALERGERHRRRLDGMRALTAALAEGTDPYPALHRLAMLVDGGRGWAALLDARGRAALVAGHRARREVAERLAGQLRDRPGSASAADADEGGRVSVLPLGTGRRDARPPGFLAVGAGPGADLDHQLVAFAASLLTLDRERDRGVRHVRRWARAATLAARLGHAQPPAPAPALGPLAAPGAPVRALVAPGPVEGLLDALGDDDAVSGLDLDGGWALVVAAEADVDEVLAAVGAVPGGLSEPVAAADPQELAGAVVRARALAERAARARPAAGRAARVLRAGDAPPSLLDLLGPRAAAFAEGVLAPLRAVPDGDVLIAALHAHLAAHGALAVAAERLGVHRHTLRARLRRAGELLGRDLDDPTSRADLWVALTAAGPG